MPRVAGVNASQFSVANLGLGIEWKFITPQGPWQGGVYERLIEIFKNCLRKAVGKALLFDYELENVVIRIESVFNTRPITQLSDHSIDFLRPIDFLQSCVPITSENFEPENVLSRNSKARSRSCAFGSKGLTKP